MLKLMIVCKAMTERSLLTSQYNYECYTYLRLWWSSECPPESVCYVGFVAGCVMELGITMIHLAIMKQTDSCSVPLPKTHHWCGSRIDCGVVNVYFAEGTVQQLYKRLCSLVLYLHQWESSAAIFIMNSLGEESCKFRMPLGLEKCCSSSWCSRPYVYVTEDVKSFVHWRNEIMIIT